MKARLVRFVASATLLALVGCATYDVEDEEPALNCRGEYDTCIVRCDEDFERDRDSWEYRNCTDYCRETGGGICTPAEY